VTTIFANNTKNEKNFRPRALRRGVKVEVVSYEEDGETPKIRYRIYNSSGGVIEDLDVEVIFFDESDKRLASYTTNLIDDYDKMGSGRERFYPSKNREQKYGSMDLEKVHKIKLEIESLKVIK
jgi:hypothetical protein